MLPGGPVQQPYARVDLIPQSGTKNLAPGLRSPLQLLLIFDANSAACMKNVRRRRDELSPCSVWPGASSPNATSDPRFVSAIFDSFSKVSFGFASHLCCNIGAFSRWSVGRATSGPTCGPCTGYWSPACTREVFTTWTRRVRRSALSCRLSENRFRPAGPAWRADTSTCTLPSRAGSTIL